MIGLFYLDIYEYLFSVITDPKTIYRFVTINKEIAEICRKQMKQKKIQCSELIEEKNPENKAIKYYRLPNGWKHGKYEQFHHDGSLQLEFMYIDNKAEGIAKTWRKKGKLKSCYNLINGKMSGLYQDWHENGKLERYGFYVNDQCEGLYQYWNDEGQLSMECYYNNGELNEKNGMIMTN